MPVPESLPVRPSCPRILARTRSSPLQCKAGVPAFVAEQMYSLFTSHQKEILSQNLRGRSLRLGTLCSGTDLCCEVLEAVVDLCGGSVCHIFSSEIAEPKQRWILQMCKPPKYLFQDVQDFTASRGYCIRSKQLRMIPGTDIIFLGFSCKDVSHQNKGHVSAKDCVMLRCLRTGSTLHGGLAYVVRLRPLLVFLENVAALDDVSHSTGASNVDEIFSLFLQQGYYLVSAIYDARKHGAAQRRTRWWGVAVRMQEGPIVDEGVLHRCKQMSNDFLEFMAKCEMEAANLDDILMDEDSEDLAVWRTEYSQKDLAVWRAEYSQDEDLASKWPELHREYFRTHGVRHPPVYELFYTEAEIRRLASLPERSRQIVYFLDKSRGKLSGDMPEEAVDVGQSINRTPIVQNGLPCICPKQLCWLRKRMRLVEPNEQLAGQGLKLYSRNELANFSRGEISDLAGNAFCANTCLAVTFSALGSVPLEPLL